MKTMTYDLNNIKFLTTNLWHYRSTRYFLLCFMLLSFTFNSFAQPFLAWANNMGGTGGDEGVSITVDAAGNVYTTGSFSGTADFDSGSGTTNLTSAGGTDIFVQKLNAAGTLVWVKSMGGTGSDVGTSIAVDAAGNVYITGTFNVTVDFDPGSGTTNLTSAGGTDVFIQKLDAAGNFVWVKQIGGASSDVSTDILVDGGGNIFTVGYFAATVDFDPNAGVTNLTSAGFADIFIQKLDVVGNLVWAKRMGGPSADWGNSIAVDASGNVYTTGFFATIADFDPGTATFNLTSAGLQDIFVSKLDAVGNFVWAKRMGSTDDDRGAAIAVDAAGDVYITGRFKLTVDFDPNAGATNLTSAGSADIFVSKLDAVGNFVWAKSMGGTGFDQPFGLALDNSANVYLTGTFNSVADFDPGVGTFNLTSTGSTDIFVSKLDAVGNFVWAYNLGSTGNELGYDIAIGGCNIYTVGLFFNTINFDPNAGTTNLTSNGNSDVYVAKYSCSMTLNASFTPSSISICEGGSIIFTDNSTGTITTWNWTFNGGLPATANTQGPHTVSFATTGMYNVTLQVGNGTTTDDTTIVITINTLDNTTSLSNDTVTANQTGATYQWLDCNNGNTAITGATNQSFNPSVSGDYAVEITLNGCTDTSACVNVLVTSIDELTQSNVLVYPNPTKGLLTINLGDNSKQATYKITTIEGKEVIFGKTTTGSILIDLNKEHKGVYFLTIFQENKNLIYKIFKQ